MTRGIEKYSFIRALLMVNLFKNFLIWWVWV